MTDVRITDDRPEDNGRPVDAPEGLHAVDDQPTAPPDAVDVPMVEESEVRQGLSLLGAGLHDLAGHPDVPHHWGFSPTEVDQLTPPLTTIINRHATARRLAQRSPEAAVALVLGRWGIRNVRLGGQIRKALADLDDAPDDALENDETAPRDPIDWADTSPGGTE